MEKEVSYIAKRYRKGRFSADKGWKRLGIASSFRVRRMRIAAAIASFVVLTGTAAVRYHHVSISETNVGIPQNQPVNPREVVRIIDFEDTPLPVVVDRIREVYGVEVVNLPDNADNYRLSLHYEGNPMELVETINDILDINMTIKE